jgi:hypothetical protein
LFFRHFSIDNRKSTIANPIAGTKFTVSPKGKRRTVGIPATALDLSISYEIIENCGGRSEGMGDVLL